MAAGDVPDGSRRAPDSARALPDALLTMRERGERPKVLILARGIDASKVAP